jgi:hypothetical protein
VCFIERIGALLQKIVGMDKITLPGSLDRLNRKAFRISSVYHEIAYDLFDIALVHSVNFLSFFTIKNYGNIRY